MKRNQLLQRIYWLSGLLVVFVLAFLTSAIFLNPSSVGNQNFLWFFNLWAFIWALIFIVLLILTFVLARNLIRLFFEYQAGHPGSRIKSKMILTFMIFSIFPSLILFFLAFGLINQNLTKWVSAPSEQLLDSSSIIAEDYYSLYRLEAVSAAKRIAEQLSPETTQGGLEQLVHLNSFEDAILTDSEGRILLEVGANQALREAAAERLPLAEGEPRFSLEHGINIRPGIVDTGIIASPVSFGGTEHPGFLFLSFQIPRSISFHVEKVREANQVYRNLKGTLASLRVNYFSILALTTLTVVFSFVWLGSYIARKVTVPLEALAEGSRELAEGNLDHRVTVSAVDELGILVDSFNRMAEQLKENRSELQKANIQLQDTNFRLDERRRYIETILQNIATGVLTIDEGEIIQTVNQAVLKMFQVAREEVLGKPIASVTDPELYLRFGEMKKRARMFGTSRSQITFKRNQRQLFVAATMTTNPAPSEGRFEYLIVLDDLTELIRAEKFSAWQEVARRLAHEFKNPLTPIQLSAERIKLRFDKLSGTLPQSQQVAAFAQVVSDSTRIIVAEALLLKNLLAEFSNFARLPISKPQPIKIHDLIDRALTLYDGAFVNIELRKEFDPAISTVEADPDQMQRVLTNLIDNALDALVETKEGRYLLIRTKLNENRGSVSLEVCDSGQGITEGDFEQLFLPYFSTKKKGTGLGLAIVRQIVTEHKGFIRAEPNVPRGTKIVVEIPNTVTSGRLH